MLLKHIVAEARQRGYERVALETGTEDYFAPPRTQVGRNFWRVWGGKNAQNGPSLGGGGLGGGGGGGVVSRGLFQSPPPPFGAILGALGRANPPKKAT